jgi:regulatory protein
MAVVVTALRSAGRGDAVRVELDGAPWRTLPLEVVMRAGLEVGRRLERPQLRLLRRELRRNEALRAATAALGRRDLSERELDERLRRRGLTRAERAETVGALRDAGFVDDGRFARSRALALAGRGYGDSAIRADLDRRGVDAEAIEAALLALEPESNRAAAIVARRGEGLATARLLARRGFDEDALEAALAAAAGTDEPRALP